MKNWLIRKDPDAGKDWRWEEKGTTEDEMVGWHHWLDGHEFEQALGNGEGQGSLACCSPWGHKQLDMTEWLNKSVVVCYGSSSKWIQYLIFISMGFKEECISPSVLPVTRKPFYCYLTDLEVRREAHVRSLMADRKKPSPLLTHVPLYSIITFCEANLWDLINFLLSWGIYLVII